MARGDDQNIEHMKAFDEHDREDDRGQRAGPQLLNQGQDPARSHGDPASAFPSQRPRATVP
jgi:hypothetical protein